jgi:FkbM family methyltransferase
MLRTATKVRIARLLYRAVQALRTPLGGTDQVTVRRRGLRWNLDLREGIDFTIYLAGAFESDTLRALESRVLPGATVLDVGANVGAHTLHLARLVGDTGRVIACEPTDFAVAKLRANLKSNPALEPRVRIYQAFLVEEGRDALVPALASSWPVDGTAPDDVEMCSRSMTLTGATARSLDSILAAEGDPLVAFMKMDVDGYEVEVLRGARRLLERSRPTIVMELAPYVFHPAEKFDELVALLTGFGYQFHPLGSARTLPSSGPALRELIPRGGSLNVVAAPKPVG